LEVLKVNFFFIVGEDGAETDDIGKYNIVFTVDTDVKMNVTIHYMCTEEVRIALIHIFFLLVPVPGRES
jgi:hypothetical protein